MLLSLVLFLIAFMMILFLNIFIEISIKDRIFFAFTVNIFTFYIFPKSGEKSGKSQSKRRKKRNKFTTFKLIPVLIEKSRIKISEINVPDILTGNGILPEFLAKPIALTLLTAMVVYLRSKSEKLYYTERKQTTNGEKLVFCATIRFKFFDALVFFLGYLRIRAKERIRIRKV